VTLRTNAEDLVVMAVTAFVSAPTLPRPPYRPDVEGMSQVPIGMAGVVYNVRVGDPAFGWAGDHVEPGVSVSHPDPAVDHALHYLTCVGNEARVVTGLAAGARGVVVGEHARLLVDFPPEVLERLCIGDEILIRTHGRGLRLLDFPGIQVKKASPLLLERWGLRVSAAGRLQVPVVAILPPTILGSGAELTPEFVDQDLMTGDRAALAEWGADRLRLGDLVAVQDADGTLHIGRQALRDAMYATENFQGLTGVLTCTPTGDCANPTIGVYQYHVGQYPPELIWQPSD